MNTAVLLSGYMFLKMIGHAISVYQGYGSQYGHSLGNVLGELIRFAVPVVCKVAKVVSTKLHDTGLH